MSGPMAMTAARTVSDLFYLALVVWREARGTSYAAQLAVANSVLNRVARPSWWGSSIDDVITKRFQYSSMTAPGDRQLTTYPKLSDTSWLVALGVAYDALYAKPSLPIAFPGADSYYDDSIKDHPPNWAVPGTYVGSIDGLNFYDVDRDHEAETMVASANLSGISTDFEKKLDAFLKGEPI